MRVALLHYSAPPVVGGVETILGEHARLFCAAGHEITLICGSGYGDVVLEEIAQTNTSALRVRAALEPWMATQDVVIVHNVLTTPFHRGLAEALTQLATDLSTVRFIAWVHDLGSEIGKVHPSFETIAISEQRRRQFTAQTGQPATVIPNGIDPARWLGLPPVLREFCRAHRVLEREFVLLQPARLVRRKNVELTLHVATALRAANRDALFLITAAVDPHTAGAAAYADELRSLRHDLDLDAHVLFLGDIFPVNDGDLVHCFALADALFLPSHQEGFALPLLEAALHRLPIFCQDLPPMNALFTHPLTTFPPAAPAEKIAALIAHRLETDATTQARKETIRRYSWDAIFERHLAPLLQLHS